VLAPWQRSKPEDLVTGTFTTIVDGKPVLNRYAYVAKRATIFDEQLIAWANRRDEELKRIRGH
jgi:hypothetical protein